MIPLLIPKIPTSVVDLVILAAELIILWIVISIPVYFAGKAVTGGKSSFGQAMGATLGGGLGYFVVYYGVSILLGGLLGSSATVIALVLGLIVWLAVFRASFDTNWLSALGIVIVAWLILLVLNFVLVHLFGVSYPDFFPL